MWEKTNIIRRIMGEAFCENIKNLDESDSSKSLYI